MGSTSQSSAHPEILLSWCLESIQDSREKELVVKTLESTNKEIVPITIQQVNDYVGNVLELESKDGEDRCRLQSAGIF